MALQPRQLSFERRYIVQDVESGLFLYPYEGDVGFTSWAHEAGRFDHYEEAVDTASMHCSAGFHVTCVC